MDLLAACGSSQQAPFHGSIDQAADTLEIAVGCALFHVDTEPVTVRDRNEAMFAAVTDIEADIRTPPIYPGERLAVLATTEGERPIGAAQPFRKDDSKRSTAQHRTIF